MKRFLLAVIVAVMGLSTIQAQTRFRSGIFLHHSTGGCIWGPNGSSTSVPDEMTAYNLNHGYHGIDSVSLGEEWFPGSSDNEWTTWHSIFETDSPEAISSRLSDNRIVMVKSCFPSSSMLGVGQPSDTATPEYRTIWNYKWHWRHIVTVMRTHPENFFVIWTNAPLEFNSTDSSEAELSGRFCRWAKDTLAAGLDPVMGAFPANVHVFDFFHKLADGAGFLPDAFRAGPGDSHPNAAATALVAPQLVTELFDAAIVYETAYNGVAVSSDAALANEEMELAYNRPNPFSQATEIRYRLPRPGAVRLTVYNALGQAVRTLVNGHHCAGAHTAVWNGRDEQGSPAATGIYFYALTGGAGSVVRSLNLIR